MASFLVGCSPEPDLEARDPGSRLLAIQDAIEQDDRDSVPKLIEMLDNDDGAVRLFAIQALEHFTGSTMGYDFAGTLAERRQAADRWETWYKDGAVMPPPQSAPADVAPGRAGESDSRAGNAAVPIVGEPTR
ncbi:MAG: hypothetical protein H7Y88_01380 [Phycisphaerales bacterium]|nr:hypothetical protein [Phycisphaerales bacterium]